MEKENTENQAVETKRDAFRKRFSERYPDVNMDDEDAVYGQLSTDYDQFDQNNQRMGEFNNFLKEYPSAPALVTGMMTKKNADGSDFNFVDFIIDEMGPDYLAAIKGDAEARKRLQQKEKDDLAASEKLAKSKEQLAKNIEDCDKEVDAFLKEQKLKPEDIKSMLEWLFKHSEDGEDRDDDGFVFRAARYALKKEDFKRLWQIKDFDKAVSDAEERGYKRGKNEKIDQQKKMHEGKPGGKKNINVSGGGGAPSIPREKSGAEQAYEFMAQHGM